MSDFGQTQQMGATMQMPVGGADSMRTQMGGVAACPICQASTPLMETYCGECGFLLASTPLADDLPLPNESALAELVDVANGRRYRLRTGLNTVGRVGTDILIDEGTVSRNHASLLVENGMVMVEDFGSSNGTKVGDRRLIPNQPVTAAHGTPMRFGNWRVMLEISEGGTAPINVDKTIVSGVNLPDAGGDKTVLEFPNANPTEAMPTANPAAEQTPAVSNFEPGERTVSVARLERTEGPADTMELAEGTITVGRKPGSTVVIPNDTFVSGRHAEIVTDSTGTYLTDLGSTNGTVVNGQKLIANERQLLLEGDEIQLGQSHFTFRFVGTPADAETEDEIERMDFEGDPQAAIVMQALTGAGGAESNLPNAE